LLHHAATWAGISALFSDPEAKRRLYDLLKEIATRRFDATAFAGQYIIPAWGFDPIIQILKKVYIQLTVDPKNAC